MSEWRETTLDSVMDIIGGGTPKTTIPEYWNGEIPWLSVVDFNNDYKTVQSTEKTITELGLNKSSTRILPKESLIISARGTVGALAQLGKDMAFNQSCYGLSAKEGTTNNFLYYLVKTKIMELQNNAHGSVFDTITRNTFANIFISLPPLPEQKAIADTLASLDNTIESNNEVSQILEEIALTMFEHLITTKTDKTCFLSEIAEINPTRKLLKKTVAKCIDMAKLSTSGCFPTDWEDKPFSGGTKFKNGDTLLARITPCLENGKTAYINFLEEEEIAFGSTEYIVIAPKEGYCGEFFYCLARYHDFVNYAVKNMNGTSGRQRVSGGTIGEYEIPIPDKDLLAEFLSVVPAFFNTIRANSLENKNLTEIRNTLLPKLMSGEVRVPLGEVE